MTDQGGDPLFTVADDEPRGIDGTPAWAYSEDGYCVCCGNGRWKFHMPGCHLRAALDALAVYQG